MRRSACNTSVDSTKLHILSTLNFSPILVLYKMCFCNFSAILELTKWGMHLVVKKSQRLLINSASRVGNVKDNSLEKWFCTFLTAKWIGSFIDLETLDNWRRVLAISVSVFKYLTMFWNKFVPSSASKRHRALYSPGRYFWLNWSNTDCHWLSLKPIRFPLWRIFLSDSKRFNDLDSRSKSITWPNNFSNNNSPSYRMWT